VDHAAGIGICSVDAPMQRQGFAGAFAAYLHSIRADLGEDRGLQETQACFRRRDEEAVRQTNADVSCRGMNIAPRKQRVAYPTDLLP
jgi:hypothetical protein